MNNRMSIVLVPFFALVTACAGEEPKEEVQKDEARLMMSSEGTGGGGGGCTISFASGETYSGTVSGCYCMWTDPDGNATGTICGRTVHSGGDHTANC